MIDPLRLARASGGAAHEEARGAAQGTRLLLGHPGGTALPA